MLPSSVRRVVPQAGGLASSLASSAPKAAAAATSTTPFIQGHQRRYSSSKPSKSGNGSSDVPADASVPAQARGSGKAGGDKRKRKADRDATNKLPSVPSTHHMVGEALSLSSFFSLHRPISITQSMPRSVTDEHFAKIFAQRSKAAKASDNMTTISNTIDQLEGPMASVTLGGQDPHASQDGMQRMDIRNPDGSESSIYLQVDAMSGDFLPFRPPPLPQPQENLEADATINAEAELADDTPLHRSYRAMFTIEESTDADGQMRIMAHSPEIVQDRQPRSFLERMAQRQVKHDEGKDMHAISVRRQRKLRMKKKKYKKLMKKTHNERRKLGRT